MKVKRKVPRSNFFTIPVTASHGENSDDDKKFYNIYFRSAQDLPITLMASRSSQTRRNHPKGKPFEGH